MVDQISEEEIPLMDENTVKMAYARYDLCMGGIPPAAVEPSLEQLTALRHMTFVSRVCPAVDFGVFGPFATRSIRKIRLAGLVLGPNGNLMQAEMYGPPCIDQWVACSMVARTAFIMLSITQPSGYDAYHELIRSYAMRYGELCWALIYQADTRARRELAERIYRRLDLAGSFLVNGSPVAMPWDLVYRVMVDEYSFWRREIEDPAIIIITKANAGGRMVEGDAPIARNPGDFIAPMDHIAGTSSGSGAYDAGSRKKAKLTRSTSNTSSQPSRDTSGNYTSSKSNVGLCPDWNSGSCVYLEKDCPKKLKHPPNVFIILMVLTTTTRSYRKVAARAASRGRGKSK